MSDDELRKQVLGAFGLKPWDITSAVRPPWRVRIWRRLTFAYRRGKAIDWRSHEAAEAEVATHDLTRTDYAFDPKDGGQRGRIACWSGPTPHVGDYLRLRNGDGSTRYQVTGVDPCWGVDPPTMWMADLMFAPRC